MSALSLARFLPGRSRGCSPIGVEFGPEAVSWVQLERMSSGLRVVDALCVKHDGDLESLLASREKLSEMVLKVMRRSQFRGRKIVTHAPTTDLRLMVLNYAEKSGQSEASQILELARERMQNDLTQHVVDYVPIRTSGDRQGDRSAMVAVVPEAPVIAHLELLRRSGLDVTALEIAPVAVRRLIVGALTSNPTARPDQVALVIRVQQNRTELTVVSGRRLLLYREIEVGQDSMIAAIAKNLDCDLDAARDLLSSFGVGEYAAENMESLGFTTEDEDFEGASGIANSLREITRPELKLLSEQAHKAISYAAFQTHGMSIETVDLIESGIACPGLAGLLSEMLQLPVASVDPMSWVAERVGAPGPSIDHRHTLALGYALRGEVDE